MAKSRLDEEIGVDVEHFAASAPATVGCVGGLGDRQERVPDGPGVDLVAGEGGGRVGRRQVDRLDVREGQAVLLQCGDQQVVGAGALADRDLPALEVGDRLDVGVRLGDDRLALAVAGQGGDVDDRRSSRLAEDRRCVAGPADIDRTDIERLDQRRPGGELDPGDADAFRLQRLLDELLLARDDRQAGLLEADLAIPSDRRRGRASRRAPRRRVIRRRGFGV